MKLVVVVVEGKGTRFGAMAEVRSGAATVAPLEPETVAAVPLQDRCRTVAAPTTHGATIIFGLGFRRTSFNEALGIVSGLFRPSHQSLSHGRMHA